MIASFLFCLAAFSPTNNNDAIFNEWCTDVGITCPGAEVRTTPRSVAGRGVFSTKDLREGEVAASIPLHVALTQDNAARYFPTLAGELRALRRSRTERRKASFASRVRGLASRVKDRLLRQRTDPREEEEGTAFDENDDDFWQAELTAYALAASSADSEHPWSTWISQWDRDDPYQALVDRGAWRDDPDAEIEAAVSDLCSMAPEISKYKIGAAVGIRLEELDEYSNRYGGYNSVGRVPASEGMYGTLISRAIGLSESVTAVLPMHDMVNHSPDPNLGFAFDAQDGGSFELFALRDVKRDDELFLSYQDLGNGDYEADEDGRGGWDEDRATWLLVQWGIPSSPPEDTVESFSVEEEVSTEKEQAAGAQL